jgi:flagellar hook-associated protein 3 FlgL
MRITESRMIELASLATSQAQQRVADASAQVSSGQRVQQPSDDPAAWAQAERLGVRSAESTQRGSAIASARGSLSATDGALATIASALAQAQALATQMANGTIDASQRGVAAVQVQSLRDTIVAAANALDGNGGYLLAGSQGGSPPFSSAGYSGDGVQRQIEIAEGQSALVTISGLALTSSWGVDIIGTLNTLAGQLGANNAGGVSALLSTLEQANAQVSQARSTIGNQMSTLDAADQARQAFEQQLAQQRSTAVDADAVGAASSLAQAKNALDSAQTVAQLIVQLTQPK